MYSSKLQRVEKKYCRPTQQFYFVIFVVLVLTFANFVHVEQFSAVQFTK